MAIHHAIIQSVLLAARPELSDVWERAPIGLPDLEETRPMAASAADPDLLFGLLALQNGLIDQDQLMVAFRAWSRDRVRPIADHLVERGGLDSDDRAAVEALVARHLKKHGGSTERSLAAIPAGHSLREGLARVGDPIIEASLARVGIEVESNGSTDADRTATYCVGAVTSDGQRFRVLRPHARGGLGAVFVALDTELHREVALKQILDTHADDPVSRQRFLLEAEVTGGLEHPGVVPVYGLGTYCDGRPFYAMRFIRGESLKEAIEQFHTRTTGSRDLELRKLLRRFMDVCNAIDYAHSRGVLHRDIKPGNIIVGKHGETLVVDWGLAKATGKTDPFAEERTLVPSSASGSAETLPGAALGTPSYMSPEQARGELDRLGPRCDVYSLGATLYCLLAGKPPFEGDDIGAILRAVQMGAFPQPRQLAPAIDKALEAVCLKAMALKPEDRYGTPKTLADDIERWMADEPVTAWREPFSRRARRWARRNRTLVTAAAVTLVAGVVGLGAVTTVQARANSDLRTANAEVRRVNSDLAAEKARVQERYDLAMEAIKTFHTGVTEDFLLKEEKFKDLRDRLLKSASDFYGKLGALLKGKSDRASRRALGQANFELAELTTKVGRAAAALEAHQQVLAYREALAKESGAGAEARVDTARSLVAIARLLEETGRDVEAIETLSRVRTLVEHPSGATTPDFLSRGVLATSLFWAGYALYRSGRHDEALKAYREAKAIREELAKVEPADIDTQRELSWYHNDVGNLIKQTGRMAEALQEYEESRRIKQALADGHPEVAEYQRDLAIAHNNIGSLLSATGKPAAALEWYGKALAILQKLAQANPSVTQFQSELASRHANIGSVLESAGNLAAALESYGKALAIQQKLAEADPSATQFQSALAWSHSTIGWALSHSGRPAAALESYGKALAIQQKLAEANPSVPQFQSDVAWSLTRTGYLLSQIGRLREALAFYTREEAIWSRLVDQNPTIPNYQSGLANCHTNMAELLIRTGRLAEARVMCDRALAEREALVRDHPELFIQRGGLAEILLRDGQVRAGQGDQAGAAAAWRRSLSIYDGISSPTGEQVSYRACCHACLSGLAGRAGSGISADMRPIEADRALQWLRQAVAAGYRSLDALRNESGLNPLRSNPDFQLLMMDVAMPDEVFAE